MYEYLDLMYMIDLFYDEVPEGFTPYVNNQHIQQFKYPRKINSVPIYKMYVRHTQNK